MATGRSLPTMTRKKKFRSPSLHPYCNETGAIQISVKMSQTEGMRKSGIAWVVGHCSTLCKLILQNRDFSASPILQMVSSEGFSSLFKRRETYCGEQSMQSIKSYSESTPNTYPKCFGLSVLPLFSVQHHVHCSHCNKTYY